MNHVTPFVRVIPGTGFEFSASAMLLLGAQKGHKSGIAQLVSIYVNGSYRAFFSATSEPFAPHVFTISKYGNASTFQSLKLILDWHLSAGFEYKFHINPEPHTGIPGHDAHLYEIIKYGCTAKPQVLRPAE
jgi:hypothetical protein